MANVLAARSSAPGTSEVTPTGSEAITRGAGRPAASAAAVIVGMVWSASVFGPTHHVYVPSASSAVAFSICGPSAATTIGNGDESLTATDAWTGTPHRRTDTGSPRVSGTSTLR